MSTSKTIHQIDRELLTLNDIDLINSEIEGQDNSGITGSYRVNLGLLQVKFVSGVTNDTISLSTSLSNEISVRLSVDNSLSTLISTEETVRLSVDNSLSTAIVNSENTYTTVSPGINVPTTVGGIVAGTPINSLTGKTFSQLFDDLLLPTVLAYINPNKSLSLNGITTSDLEVGTPYVANVTTTFNQGMIYNGNGISSGSNLVGPATLYTFKLPGGSTDGTPSLTSIHMYTSYTIAIGSNIWSVTTDYSQGTGNYYDNKGVLGTNLDASRVASSISASSNTITGKRYAWWGYGMQGSAPTGNNVRNLTSKSFLTTSNTGTFTISIPSGTQEVYFFIPAGKTVSVKYVESSNAEMSFVQTPTIVDDAGGVDQSYTSYVQFIGLTGYLNTATYTVTIT
jgi:hypothetical protein